MEFTLKANINFDAKDISQAFEKLSNHFCFNYGNEEKTMFKSGFIDISPRNSKTKIPKIICLCGSMRKCLNEIITKEKELSLQGYIVLTPGVKTVDVERDNYLSKYKPMLDELHLRKIDLSDEIFVINPGGYVGESTIKEIEYAVKCRKGVKFQEPPKEKEHLINIYNNSLMNNL